MTAKYVNTVIDYQGIKKINGIAFLLQKDLHAERICPQLNL